jgi:hypothetical protein
VLKLSVEVIFKCPTILKGSIVRFGLGEDLVRVFFVGFLAVLI